MRFETGSVIADTQLHSLKFGSITNVGVIAEIMEHLFPEENKNIYEWQQKPGYGYAIEQHNYSMLQEITPI